MFEEIVLIPRDGKPDFTIFSNRIPIGIAYINDGTRGKYIKIKFVDKYAEWIKEALKNYEELLKQGLA